MPHHKPAFPMFCNLVSGREFIVYVRRHWSISYVEQQVYDHLHHELKLIDMESYVELIHNGVKMERHHRLSEYYYPEPERFFYVTVVVRRW